VPGEPRRANLWSKFADCVSQEASADGATIHIADSKVVHSAALGIAAIERSATAILRLAGRTHRSLFALWDDLTDGDGRERSDEPWFLAYDVSLPVVEAPSHAVEAIERWEQRCHKKKCRLVGVACEVLTAKEFNRACEQVGSKGQVLSLTTLRLLRRLWKPADEVPALVLCDKHGGRDYYAEVLADVFPETLPLSLQESRSLSRYRLGSSEVRFQVGSEQHLPVAAASIVAKYVREACMESFNAYWLERQPELRPTRGYPTDARRFLQAIEVEAADLGLARETYWRGR
jgi:ribonuclease HII